MADSVRRGEVKWSRVAAIERNPAAVSAGQLLEILKVLGVDLVLRDADEPSVSSSQVQGIPDTGPQGV